MVVGKYEEAIDWLFNIRRFGAVRTLEPVTRLMGKLGNPHKSYKSIHIAGTNGKGSTTALIASILRAHGFKVGLYTSPHLERFTERIVVDGEEIPKSDVVRLASLLKPIVEELSTAQYSEKPVFFDIVTAMAFKYFEEKHVDFAVLEVGLGGRLDATNIVEPLVSVITNISLEHTEVLGDTILKIAYEKAGIIKPNSILVTATQDDSVFDVFKEICDQLNTVVYRVGVEIVYNKIRANLDGQFFRLKGLGIDTEFFMPLLGGHQLSNASSAVGAVASLSKYGIIVSENSIKEGLRTVKWPGRLEVMQKRPLVILDCAKDAAAMKALSIAVQEIPHDRLIAVLSISSDKNIPEMVKQLSGVVDKFIVTLHGVMGRAAKPKVITDSIATLGKPFEVVDKVVNALDRALEVVGERDMVLVTGSVFLVGEARQRWKGVPL